LWGFDQFINISQLIRQLNGPSCIAWLICVNYLNWLNYLSNLDWFGCR